MLNLKKTIMLTGVFILSLAGCLPKIDGELTEWKFEASLISSNVQKGVGGTIKVSISPLEFYATLTATLIPEGGQPISIPSSSIFINGDRNAVNIVLSANDLANISGNTFTLQLFSPTPNPESVPMADFPVLTHYRTEPGTYNPLTIPISR